MWDSSIVSGGESVKYPDAPNEYREFVVEPTMDMASGSYDIRSQAVDSRGQTSDWVVNENAFSLMNSLPQISQDPITVKVDTTERVSMKNHITDAESPGDISGLKSQVHMQLSWHGILKLKKLKFILMKSNTLTLNQQPPCRNRSIRWYRYLI